MMIDPYKEEIRSRDFFGDGKISSKDKRASKRAIKQDDRKLFEDELDHDLKAWSESEDHDPIWSRDENES
jgi:hypothetical protein